MTTHTSKIPVTVAPGDGIGPEITEATLRLLTAAGAQIEPELISVGLKAYEQGHAGGIAEEGWESISRTKVLLKGPVTTPQGGGMKSLNVTLRTALGLFANVRPCRAFAPFIPTMHPKMDLVVIRENEEDVYTGIEHRQTDEVYQCLKLVSRPGCERIARYAFEYARAHGRKRVTCMTKDNIMKMTDGLFRRVFEEVGAGYPDIERDHVIIDIGTALVAERPERFDVILVPNLYGDILSDVTVQLSGSVGLGSSSNVGIAASMFEAVHGSAPDIAGRGIANPSGLMLAAFQMLVHIGQADVAARAANAWLATIEDGVHPGDIYREESSKERVGTAAFTDAIISRLGKVPNQLKPFEFRPTVNAEESATVARIPARKEIDGIDIFIHENDRSPESLADRLLPLTNLDVFELQMITNRGVKVWPNGNPATFCSDHWRCRFVAKRTGNSVTPRALVDLIGRIVDGGVHVIKTENLYTFDGERGYSLAQGQ